MTMYYFALLQVPERSLTPAEGQAEMQAYTDFHARAADAIRAGDALAPAAEAVQITGGPDRPVVTDGPFAEGAEVAGGYYMFEADDLDEALQLARQVPAARYGAVTVWPAVYWNAPSAPTTGNDWLALLLESGEVAAPGSPEWEAGPRSTGRSTRPPATMCSAVRCCTHRRPRRRSGCATARCCSPMDRSPRALRWPTGSTCCGRRP
jgi:hypothetical protein